MTAEQQNSRIFKGFALTSLVLLAIAAFLLHQVTYTPAVAYIPLYLALSVWVASGIAAALLPAHQFTSSGAAFGYAYFGAVLAVLVFFTGGSASELYVLFFPILLAAALHRSRMVPLVALGAALIGYSLAVLPNLVSGVESPGLMLFRLAAFGVVGVLGFLAQRGRAVEEEAPTAPMGDEEFALDPDGSLLLERVSHELDSRRGVPVAVILVDPGRGVNEMDALLEKVSQRVEEPILLGEGSVFGLVLTGANDRVVEGASRRVFAVASSLGAEQPRAGAAIYPRDARAPEDLLLAAGQALEAAFEVESPSALVIADEKSEPASRAAQ